MVCAVTYVLKTWIISLLALPSITPVLTASCTDAEKTLRSGIKKFKCHSGSGLSVSMVQTLATCVSVSVMVPWSSEGVLASLVLAEVSRPLS